jgi:chromosome segregation ATPase
MRIAVFALSGFLFVGQLFASEIDTLNTELSSLVTNLNSRAISILHDDQFIRLLEQADDITARLNELSEKQDALTNSGHLITVYENILSVKRYFENAFSEVPAFEDYDRRESPLLPRISDVLQTLMPGYYEARILVLESQIATLNQTNNQSQQQSTTRIQELNDQIATLNQNIDVCSGNLTSCRRAVNHLTSRPVRGIGIDPPNEPPNER